tara:strand:- start:1185 stop:1349 length:165 start_codon:yes stop_codon:yes gene_type:complete
MVEVNKRITDIKKRMILIFIFLITLMNMNGSINIDFFFDFLIIDFIKGQCFYEI